MSGYQIFLLCVLVVWPLAIAGLLFLMSKLEDYVKRPGATTPEEAGLEPVQGSPPEREVTIVFGDRVVGEPEAERRFDGGAQSRPAGGAQSRPAARHE